MIDKTDPVSITRQAELLDLSRSSLYYEPVGVSEADLLLMAAMDELHLPSTGPAGSQVSFSAWGSW